MNHEQFIELVKLRADLEAQLRFIEEQREIVAEQTRRILELFGRSEKDSQGESDQTL